MIEKLSRDETPQIGAAASRDREQLDGRKMEARAPICQVKIAAKVHESAILSFVVNTMPS